VVDPREADFKPRFETADGQDVISFELTEEHFEILKSFTMTPGYQIYRRLLLQAKEAYTNTMLPIDEAIPLAKRLGMVTGINFAINQVPIIVGTYEAKKKKLQEIELLKKKKQESLDHLRP
jgi:hypothetical protein